MAPKPKPKAKSVEEMAKTDTQPTKDGPNKGLFEKYACMGCSLDEIRGVLWMDRDDLEAWIEEAYRIDCDEVLKRFRGRGVSQLRESLLEFANTNAHVAKWMGQLMFGDQKGMEDDVVVRVWSELDKSEKLKPSKKRKINSE